MWMLLIGLFIALIAYVVLTYNSLIALIEAVRNNEKQIDVQLDRRFKVFENLINVVRKAMDYEQTTLKQIVELRNQAQAARANGKEQERQQAENAISALIPQIQVVVEQYPALKANDNAMQFQEEIVSTENKLAFAKQAFNDSIERYNAKKKSLFPSLVVAIFPSQLDRHFQYWQLTAEQVQQKEQYQVKL